MVSPAKLAPFHNSAPTSSSIRFRNNSRCIADARCPVSLSIHALSDGLELASTAFLSTSCRSYPCRKSKIWPLASSKEGPFQSNQDSRIPAQEAEECDGRKVSALSISDSDDREVYNSSENESIASSSTSSSGVESILLGVKEPVYEVLEVDPQGHTVNKLVSRRQLLKQSGLRLRDTRCVDPTLSVTNSAPTLLVRDQAILVNLGSLRAIATPDNVLIFNHKSVGGQAFLESLLQRLNPENAGNLTMPFELEAVESALISRTQRLEQALGKIEPRVQTLLEILPNRLTANILEELRLAKQELVELAAKAGALRQMLLDLLENSHDIRRMTILGHGCKIRKEDGKFECMIPLDKQVAEDEEEEIEMLIENYLQRCESCHAQTQKLLDSAKEMEDSIAVNLSSRRLEVSRLELLLQVGTFCSAIGALIAGIFGMNLRSYLEEHMFAFWLTSAGIIFGGIALFIIMFTYLKRRKIL